MLHKLIQQSSSRLVVEPAQIQDLRQVSSLGQKPRLKETLLKQNIRIPNERKEAGLRFHYAEKSAFFNSSDKARIFVCKAILYVPTKAIR
jgi:hypothetical protein